MRAKTASNRKKLIVIAGPTGSGKSALAVELARRFGGEVVSADSRQVYRGLDVGSHKITPHEMRGIPHHLLDVASPKRTFTAAQYQKLARREIREIWKRGKLPILCGGTGLYLQAAVDGIVMPAVRPNPALRKRFAKRTAEELYSLLMHKDPARAAAIDPKNPRRLIRALEIAEALGKVPGFKTRPLPADTFFIGIAKEKNELRRYMRARIALWLRRGLLKEVRALLKAGVSEKKIREFGLVYRWALRLLKKEMDKGVFEEGLVRDLMRYVKRQMTWFKKDTRIRWISGAQEARQLAKGFLEK